MTTIFNLLKTGAWGICAYIAVPLVWPHEPVIACSTAGAFLCVIADIWDK